HINRQAVLVGANLSARDLTANRRPTVGLLAATDLVVRALAEASTPRPRWATWQTTLRARDAEREKDIAAQAAERPSSGLNPLSVCREIDGALDDQSIVVADG